MRHAGWRDECFAASGPTQWRRRNPRPHSLRRLHSLRRPHQAAPDPAAPAADAQQAAEEPIGNVATVIGSASVVRNNETTPLKVKDDIYLNDVVQTGAKSALGITFSDATTFNLKANSQITIDSYVYEDGGKKNAGVFDVAKGTVAFVAAAVAKTGDMKITTPTATLGIRGTTGLVEVPEGAAANNPNNVAIKLYPDADGRVGRIEVNDRAGARLGFLNQGVQRLYDPPRRGGARFAAVPLTISPQQMLRDQGFVRQLHSTQNLGRRVFSEQRDFRRANPGFNRGNAPRRGPQQNGLPGQNRTGQQPGLNRPGQQQPGLQNRPGQQQPGSAEPSRTTATAEPAGSAATDRARLTGRVSNCSATGFAAANRIAAATGPTAGDSGTAGPGAPVQSGAPAQGPVARSASSRAEVHRNCARRPAVRRKAFSNRACGKACGRVDCGRAGTAACRRQGAASRDRGRAVGRLPVPARSIGAPP